MIAISKKTNLNNCKKALLIILYAFLYTPVKSFGTRILVDQIIAKVGDQPILLSEVESTYAQMIAQENGHNVSKKDVLNHIIESKLLISKAKKEGITISEDRLNQELNYKINYLIEKLGSIPAVESYFGKSIYHMKIELSKQIKDHIYAEEMSSKILSNIQTTPEEVVNFFKSLKKADIPYVSTEYIVWQLVKKPVPSESEINSIKAILLTCKQQLESDKELYFLYETIAKNETIANFQYKTSTWTVGDKDAPEYEKEILDLTEGQFSQIIIKEKGLFLVKIISKKLNTISAEYIYASFCQKKVYIEETKKELLKIKTAIESKNLTFEEAINIYSDSLNENDEQHEPVNINGLKCELKDLPIDIIYAMDDKKITPGAISNPIVSEDINGAATVKLIFFKKEIPAHHANLEQDYEKINQMCIAAKREAEFNDWFEKTKISNEVWIDASYKW